MTETLNIDVLDDIQRVELTEMAAYSGENHLPLKDAIKAGRIWCREGQHAAWVYLMAAAERERALRGDSSAPEGSPEEAA